MADPEPEGIEVERVDWLPSGGRSGLVRVRGRWRVPGPLPDLVIQTREGEERHVSLPDPRGGRDPAVWRGAYVIQADAVARSGDRMALVLQSGARVALPRPSLEGTLLTSVDPPPESSAKGGEVVDRAVLAERRARRAEAAEQAQARIAREALRAVEVLELRSGQLEEQLDALTDERDRLSAAEPVVMPAGDPAEAERLRARVAELEAQIERLRARPAPPVPVAPVEPAPDPEADRRVERLRGALATAIVTIGDLRLALHEARVRRRTADVQQGADGVRLAVLTAERGDADRELAALRDRLAQASEREVELRAEAERAAARTAETEAARDELRRRLDERDTELEEARTRLAALESEVASARDEAERIVAEDLPAAVRDAENRREAQLRVEQAEAAEAAEALLAEARGRVEDLEAELASAATAREIAEADAAAARAERRAAEVALTSLTDEMAGMRREQALAEARRATAAPVDPAGLGELARKLQAARPEPRRGERLVADLEAAAASLRARTPAGEVESNEPEPVAAESEPAQAEPEPEPEPVAAEPASEPEPEPASGSASEHQHEPVAETLPAAEPVAEPPAGDADPEGEDPEAHPEAADPEAEDAPEAAAAPAFLPPAPPDIRAERERSESEARRAAVMAALMPGPSLRGALVRLAGADPVAAAAIIAGLLPAQWRILDRELDYDLTIAELGTYAVRVAAHEAHVEAVEGPRRGTDFHLRADARTLAEMLAGGGPRPRRFGRAKVSGRHRRRVRALGAAAQTSLTLADVLGAGAQVDPILALRCLAHAIEPEWTLGTRWVIAHTLTDPEATLYLRAGDGTGLGVSAEPPSGDPDATITITRAAFAALLRGLTPPERPVVRGDLGAVDQLHEWADAVRSGRPPNAG